MKIISAILISLIASSPAYADDLKLQLRSDFNPVSIVNNGKPGVWFPVDEAEYLLKLRTDIAPSLISMVNNNTKLIDSLKLQVSEYQNIANLQQKKADEEAHLSTALQQDLIRCQDENKKFYKSPVFWGIAGVVAGVVTTVLIAHATK